MTTNFRHGLMGGNGVQYRLSGTPGPDKFLRGDGTWADSASSAATDGGADSVAAAASSVITGPFGSLTISDGAVTDDMLDPGGVLARVWRLELQLRTLTRLLSAMGIPFPVDMLT